MPACSRSSVRSVRSPRTHDSHPHTTGADTPTPRLPRAYVVLPGHPFYGHLVQIVRYRRKGETLSCLITAPHTPDLHYQLPARWLSATHPPPAVAPARAPTAIALSLAALDTLTQRVLALCSEEFHHARCLAPSDLGSAPAGDDRPPEHTALPFGPAAHERSGQ
jgi:hypothetical protein